MALIKEIIGELQEHAEELGLDYLVPVIARLGINELDIITEYAEQAALYGYVAAQYAEARINRKRVEGQTGQEIREDSDSKKKPTIQEIEELVSVDDAVVDSRKTETFLEAVHDAFKHRLQMLISMGADLREESRATGLAIPKADKDRAVEHLEDKARTTLKRRGGGRRIGKSKRQPVKKG